MRNILITTVAASSLWFTSCGDKKTETDTGVNKDGLKPAEAVENWKKDVTDGRLASLWDSLPENYQADVSKLAHSFGEKVDGELYNEAMKTVSSASALLKNKKSMILEFINEQAPENEGAAISENYDSVVGLLAAIANSDAKDAEGMKKLDVAKFLGTIQVHTKKLASLATLAEEDIEDVMNAKIKLVSESGDSAVVNVAADDKNEDIKLIKKGSRWLPAEMVDEWPEMMEEANEGLAELGNMKAEDKQGAMMMLKMVQTAITDLETSKDKDEMMKKIEGLANMFGGE